MLDKAREGRFLECVIVCTQRKVYRAKINVLLHINTLYTCLFCCSELQLPEPVGCSHSPKNDLRKHWMSERGQTHELQNKKKNSINICYIFKSIFLSSTTDVQNLDKYTWLNWRGASTGSTNLRFTLVWILVSEGTRANHAHAAWALRQRQCAAQGRSSVQLQWSVLSRDAVRASHSWRSTNRAGYYKENRQVDVLSVKIEAKKATSVHQYSPIHVLEVRGREVGEDSGRVSESVMVRIEWECLLSPFSFTSSSTCEAPLKIHEYKERL